MKYLGALNDYGVIILIIFCDYLRGLRTRITVCREISRPKNFMNEQFFLFCELKFRNY